MDWTDYRVNASPCPGCGAVQDGASNVTGDGGPIAGDLSVCVYCGAVSVFDSDLELRPIDAAELATLDRATRERLDEMRRAVKMIRNPQ